MSEISARAARYDKVDPELAEDLKRLRQDVRDIFNKGLKPGDDILEQLWFLDPKTRDLVEKLSKQYDDVITPDDFKAVAKIMSEYLGNEVPVLKNFTRYFGRLAEDFLLNAKPEKSAFDWKSIAKISVFGSKKSGYKLPLLASELLGLKAQESVSEKFLKRFLTGNSSLRDFYYGVDAPKKRRTGFKFFKIEVKLPDIDLENLKFGKTKKVTEYEILYANKLPKAWTNVPWVNFDGKVLEQNYTQVFEERLRYRDRDGNWITNILQVPQKTEASWWDQISGESGKINDIADVTKARTAYGVNGNHSNDAVLVKKFHLWGKSKGVGTSTVHDAFFTNVADMLEARQALREIYAESLRNNVVLMVLEEMKKRGLPDDIYKKYMDEAIDIGLIPVPGRSVIDGKVMTEEDILRIDDILKEVPGGFDKDYGFYGIG